MIVALSVDIASQFEKKTGIEVLPLNPYPSLDTPVASHSDMLICKIDNTVFCYEDYYLENKDTFLKISNLGYDIKFVSSECTKKYPNDIALNVLIIGKKIFCYKKNTAPEILEYGINNEYEIIDIKQGYSACSTLVLNENSAITGDLGVAKALKNHGIEVALINTSNIILSGYNSGFIGGASGVIGNTIYLFGPCEILKDNEEAISLIKAHNFQVVSILHDQVYDFGGIKQFWGYKNVIFLEFRVFLFIFYKLFIKYLANKKMYVIL